MQTAYHAKEGSKLINCNSLDFVDFVERVVYSVESNPIWKTES